ncbi:hypothetical protein [Mucilaginibacter sp. KACC 22063]|uniref:hypothetical protein n=1 Tax=Mucilaginibacter sp. KACC 22063 TaxID=3025666 RepID=UPI002366B57E|nr:hypothetical protein [Mucilaginibacter sp. KACC 22063]WDF54337.1 hypothetical protein PQ461_15440 [Mucilaginibacter sp. KACC 22063]
MSGKLRLLETAFENAATDSAFLAFFITKYQEAESINAAAVATLLQCEMEAYYRLGLCTVPDVGASNYLSELNKISGYIGISAISLNQILKRAVAIVKLSGTTTQSALLAARDKGK